MHNARVYFYLRSLAEAGVGCSPVGAGVTAPGDGSTLGLSESEIMSFIHDANHRCELIRTPEKTHESARQVLESKHPHRTVHLKTVTWLS
jgi:hypothetical protein